MQRELFLGFPQLRQAREHVFHVVEARPSAISSVIRSLANLIRSQHSPLASELAAVLSRVGLEVGDELVKRILHVHVADLGPHFVLVGQVRLFVLGLALLILEGVTDRLKVAESANKLREELRLYSPVLCPILDLEQVVAHGLIREFV